MATIRELLKLANEHYRAGELPQAETICREILQTDPNQASALHLLGVMAQEQGRGHEALELMREALALEPQRPEFHNSIGVVYRALGEVDLATQSFRRALELDPHHEDAKGNLRQALLEVLRQKRDGQSPARSPSEEAILLNSRGLALQARGSSDKAIACFQQALRNDQTCVPALYNLANAYKEQERLEDAADSFGKLARLQPDQPLWRLQQATLCPKVFQSSEQIDGYRQRLLRTLQCFAGTHIECDPAMLPVCGGGPPWTLQFHGRDDRPIKEAYVQIFQYLVPDEPPPCGRGRPRVGFVVTDSHEPVFLKDLRGVIERTDAGAFESVIICSSAGAKKVAEAFSNDAVTTMVLPDRFDQMIQAIRDGRFDVLHHWEIGTDAVNYFLPFFRLAPVQCTAWGVAVTSGIPQVGHYLSSELIEPEDAADHYSEELILAKTILAYRETIPPLESPKRREQFGFAAGQHLYGCGQQLGKLHPDFDPVIASILRRDEDGIVILIADRGEYLARRLRRRFETSMPDVSDRIRFIPGQSRADYRSLLAAADVLLDPLHFTGASSTYEGLALGKAIVTLPCAYRRGRFTLACYRKMQMRECVVSTPKEYVSKAVELGTEADYRRSVEERIRETAPVLFEDAGAASEYERILVELIEVARTR